MRTLPAEAAMVERRLPGMNDLHATNPSLHMRHARHIVLPAALALLGVWVLAGCLYIPTFGTTVKGRNASKSVGAARSGKPIGVARSSAADVIRLLGEPTFATADRSVFAYPWTVRNGYAVWPLCFGGYSVLGERTLVLRFAGDERLRSYEVLRRDDPVIQINSMGSRAPLPPEIEEEMRAARMKEYERGRSSTRPATAPVTRPE
jgi:hypothetical protein